MDKVFLTTKAVFLFKHLLSGNLHKSKMIFDSVRFHIQFLKWQLAFLSHCPFKYLIALVCWYTEPLKNHNINPMQYTLITSTLRFNIKI